MNKPRPSSQSVEQEAVHVGQSRILFTMGVICFIFASLIFRLFDICLSSHEDIKVSRNQSSIDTDFITQRSAIEDRNGNIVAVNLTTASLFANPNKILDRKATIDKLCTVYAKDKCQEIAGRIKAEKPFVWLKRHITPVEQQTINDLGLVGINFMKDEKRLYPHGNLFAHVVGYVDVDGNGLAGIERSFDDQLKSTVDPVKLALDIRIQQILRDEILNQAIEHNAIGGSGVVMDVNTGEIIAMVSLPDYDPHNPATSSDRQRFNQVTLGAYEMGSTFKILTLAMALDNKNIHINDVFNTDEEIKIGNHKIKNYRGKGGIMATPEVLMYSSNIGSAQIGIKVGQKKQREYLKEFGMLDTLDIEIPEKAHPIYPAQKLWTQASTITIAFGHGIAVTPLHVVRAVASVVNGGYLVKPTFLKVESPEQVVKTKVLDEKTSDTMRKLLRMVVVDGYGKKADAKGYFVGGKTGTAEKLNGRTYSKNANLASFLGAFPIHNPKYAIVIIIDEALPNKINGGFTTGGMVAAPVAGRVIERIAPILGVRPERADNVDIQNKLDLKYTPRNPMTLGKNKN